MARDFYTILGCPRDADDAALKRAFRDRAREHHPDYNQDDVEGAQERFKEVKAAYDFLRSPEKRAQYDRLLELKESGRLDQELRRARFGRVPFIPLDEEEEPETPSPSPPRHGGDVPYPQVPADAHLHPDVSGWWVPVPPDGRQEFMPNPYYDPVVAAATRRRDAPRRPTGASLVAELVELVTKKRWR